MSWGICILYFSGVGNTQMVAEAIYEELDNKDSVEIHSIESLPGNFNINHYSKIIIGAPTYHSGPALPLLNFLKGISKLERPVPAFLFTTCGLYSANTLRIMAKVCQTKNIVSVMSSSYRCSATDAILMVPLINFFSRHEKKLWNKIKYDANKFNYLKQVDLQIPRFKLYSILNYPNKWMGQRLCVKIRLHKNLCIQCKKCIVNCPQKTIEIDMAGFPRWKSNNCINCYRCIHHCPQRALSLSEKTTPKMVWK